MDSGMLLKEDETRLPFNPLAPLLPEELCWIIDRSFACDVSNYKFVITFSYHPIHRLAGMLGTPFHKLCTHYFTSTLYKISTQTSYPLNIST